MGFPSLKCVRLLLALMFALMKAIQKYIRALINHASIKDDGKSFWKMVWPLLNICAAQIQQEMVRSMRLGNFTNNFKTTICGFCISYTEYKLYHHHHQQRKSKSLQNYFSKRTTWKVVFWKDYARIFLLTQTEKLNWLCVISIAGRQS